MWLTKHHGLGNDFLVALVDEGEGPGAAAAKAVCDRTRGIGADGLLTVGRGEATDLTMVLHNADGGRAEMSGNGISCLVQAALRAGWVEGPVVTVASDVGTRTVDVVDDDGVRTTVRVDLGPIADPQTVASLPEGTRRGAVVDVGNPHLVLLVDDHDAVDLAALGQQLDDETPGGTNVETVVVDGDSVSMRVFERGVGLTDACGTGACASAAAVRAWGLAGDRIGVAQPGGDALVELGATTHYTVTVEAVCRAEWPWPA